jgi:hypothetical protein
MGLLPLFVGLLFLTFVLAASANDTSTSTVSPAIWPLKLVSLDATCGADSIHVSVKFEKPFNGIVYSKGAFYTPDCVYVLPGTGEMDYNWEIPINQCETTETKPSADSKMGERSFENTVVFQVSSSLGPGSEFLNFGPEKPSDPVHPD